MALTGIINLADRLVNQSGPQTQQSAATSASTTSPAAATSGVQQSSPQTNLSTASPISPETSPASGVPKGSRVAGATFQVQDLVIRFASIGETRTTNANNTQSRPQSTENSKPAASDSSTSVLQVNALNLGVEEISVTLNSSLGQRTRVHVPRSESNQDSASGPSLAATALAKSAKA